MSSGPQVHRVVGGGNEFALRYWDRAIVERLVSDCCQIEGAPRIPCEDKDGRSRRGCGPQCFAACSASPDRLAAASPHGGESGGVKAMPPRLPSRRIVPHSVTLPGVIKVRRGIRE